MPDGPTTRAGSGSPEASARPGPLSLLLQELARAPDDDLLRAWEQALHPGDLVGRFEILREVGRGGFGVVYQALDRELGRVVAFKTLRTGRTSHELAADWIQQEAEAVARLDHPAIVTLFDMGCCGSGPYLVEEFLRGATLGERLRAGPLGIREALSVALQVAGGLAHAHTRGVLHRDLKPGNIMVTDEARVKLLDFGLAHLLGTRGRSGAGTPAYMAPEQARGEPVTKAADVFALGVVLFEMLAGKRPFEVKEGRSEAVDPGPTPSLQGKVPAPLVKLVARCLSRDPAGRPENGQAVVEELLAVQRALERPAAVRRWIQLVGGGVVLGVVAAVLWIGRPWDRPPRVTRVPSVAVLPFADMSPQHDQEHFSDGTAEEILNALARVEGLRVTGRTSSFSFKGKGDDLRTIGRKLGVGAVVEGSVRKAGNRFRITAELVTVDDGYRLWSEVFERELGDIFAVQDEIALAVVQALRVRLLPDRMPRTGKHQTASSEAYDQFLLGRQFASRLDYARAVAAFRRALELDRGYAPAWAWLASCLTSDPDWKEASTAGAAVRRRATEAAETAIALAPDLTDGYAARGHLRRTLLWDWDGARADLEHGLRLDPRNVRALGAYAMLLGDLGLFPEAIGTAGKLVEIEPLSALAWGWLGAAGLAGARFDVARRAYGRALEIAPESPILSDVLVRLDLLEGNAAAARAGGAQLKDAESRLFFTTLAESDLGHTAAAQQALEAFRRGPGGDDAIALAEIHAWRGARDLAFDWLERAHAQHAYGLGGVKADPMLRKLHGEPRWKALLVRMRLPPD